MDQQQLIADVVEEVIRQMAPGRGRAAGASRSSVTPATASRPATGGNGRPGVFDDVDAAVDAAEQSQRQLAAAGLEVRDGICKLIKQIVVAKKDEWAKIELDETKLGRLDHKILKLELLAGIPGVEFLKTAAHSGDGGIGLDEAAPWGVLGVITPVTHSIPTLTANAINMIAAGNSMVVNAHPSGAKCAAAAAETYNRAIAEKFGIGPLICIIGQPTLRSAEEIFKHERIPLLIATGGPAVARAAMKQPKRAIVAGPGNPPVVVDETADLDKAAQGIILGGAFDNNLLCIGEKEVFVVASVFDKMMAAMRRAGAVELSGPQVDKLTAEAITWQKDHHVANKDFIGKDCDVLGRAAGVNIAAGVDLLFGETDESNPFVPVEQMMPFVPFVRVPDFERGMELAIEHEHGFGHTAIIHSNNLERITRMGRAMNTTLFAVNGPSTGCLGIGGEGYASYSIATPTGEGVTNPLTFTRFRRMTVSDALRIA
jgi:aldehyde dehydrogenase